MKDTIKTILREDIGKMITKLSIFDFDGTLVDTPLPDKGRIEYEEKTGKKWPYEGWWGRKESLDTTIFDMSLVDVTMTAYKEELSTPNTLMVMMTGRMSKLSGEVKHILDTKNLSFDKYLFNRGGGTLEAKIKSLDALLVEFPNVKTVEMWDDRIPHIPEFQKWGDSKDGIDFKINLVNGSHH